MTWWDGVGYSKGELIELKGWIDFILTRKNSNIYLKLMGSGDYATPIRCILTEQRNAHFVL